MQALYSCLNKYPVLPLGTSSYSNVALACKLGWVIKHTGFWVILLCAWHVGSSIVNKMSHLNYPLLHCYLVHEWSQLSTDEQCISCAYNWLVFAGFSEGKGLCSGHIYGMPCIGIFSLGTGTLQDELNLHTCYNCLCFYEPI